MGDAQHEELSGIDGNQVTEDMMNSLVALAATENNDSSVSMGSIGDDKTSHFSSHPFGITPSLHLDSSRVPGNILDELTPSSSTASNNSTSKKRKDNIGDANSRKKKSNKKQHSNSPSSTPSLMGPFTTSTNQSGQLPMVLVPLSTNMLNTKFSNSFPVILSTLSPTDQDQYQQFLLQQSQYLENIRVLRENQTRVLQTSEKHPNESASIPHSSVHNDSEHETQSFNNHDNSTVLSSTTTSTNGNPLVIPLIPPITVQQRQHNGRFTLLEQPSLRQRKSYKAENRYLLPNPLIVSAREPDPDEIFSPITGGKITVSLMNTEGETLPLILQCIDGGLTQDLDPSTRSKFSLKVLETSEGTMFRLLFSIVYTVKDNENAIEEKILSNAFQVTANRKKNAKEFPVVIEMKPKEALSVADTEVWIKGKGFSDRVVVTFGNKSAKILEAAENLITCLAPARADIVPGTPVNVTVSNKFSNNELLAAQKQLTFYYL